MQIMRALTTATVALLAAYTVQDVTAKSPLEYEHEFAAWMKDHHITFSDALEYVRRLENYIANDLLIVAHNMEKTWGFTLGHNQFSHMTFAEFKQYAMGLKLPPGYLEERLSKNSTELWKSTKNVPDEVDWVAKGAVTAVKNQGQCGSCWAFSTTGAVEGATFVSSGQLPNLSEQELVDCDDNGDMGCNGGLMDHAFDWIENHNGLCAETDYEYKAQKGVCRTCKEVVKVTGYQDVEPNNEIALKVAVAQQPVSVAIEADQREFQFYKTGVFDKPCGTQLDHGVLLVGYGVDQGQKFWKIKNSWSSTWGENGYIRISREVGNTQGQCGVAMAPSYPFASTISNAKYLRSVDIKNKVEAKAKITEETMPVKSSAKITQCGDKSKAAIIFDTLTIAPQAPKRGHPITFTGNGAAKAEIDSAAFHLSVRLAGEHVFGHDGKLCGETHIPLPLGLGHIDVHGLQCPLKQGAQSGLKVDVRLPAIAPAGNYQIELLAGNGASKDSLFCVDVELDLNDAENASTSQKANVYEFMADSVN